MRDVADAKSLWAQNPQYAFDIGTMTDTTNDCGLEEWIAGISSGRREEINQMIDFLGCLQSPHFILNGETKKCLNEIFKREVRCVANANTKPISVTTFRSTIVASNCCFTDDPVFNVCVVAAIRIALYTKGGYLVTLDRC